MKRNKCIFLLGTLLLSFLFGCSSTANAPSTHTVTLIAKSTETEFWLSVFAGAEAAAAEYNMNLKIVGPKTEEDTVEDGTEALIFSAIHYDKNAAAIDAASQSGVEIVAIDSNVASDAVSTYIGTDNYAAGQMAAQAALERVDGQLNIGIVNYDISSANGQEREQGAVDLLNSSGRARVVAVINTLAEAQQAKDDTLSLLEQYPEINVLLAFNEPTSVGAAMAIQELACEDSIFLVGFDSNVASVDGLQDGSVDALVVQNPYAMGYLGVESAYKLLNGKGNELEKIVDTSTQIVDRENLFSIDSQKALFAFE